MGNTDLRKLTKKERQEARDRGSVPARLKKLDEVYDSFCDVRADIEILLEECDTDDEEMKKVPAAVREQAMAARAKQRSEQSSKVLKTFIQQYFRLKQTLEAFMHGPGSSSQLAPAPTNNPPTAASPMRVKLPELKIPTFRGSLMEWVTFRDTFKTLIVDNPHLTDFDMFTYLRTSLAGEALQQIASIDLTADNYSIAWRSLESRYENKKLLVKCHIDALFAVNPMKKESFEALNHVIGEFEKHLQMLTKLGENTQDWSTLLAHMLASKLDPTTQRLWETEHRSTDVPKYDDMLKFLLNHRTVLRSISGETEPPKEPEKPSKFSSSYSVQQQACPFCSDGQHWTYQCKQ
ncbi:uncharacterized protein LOC134290510 [Aedes albopictus]|uniref:Uncharacterized protein n=1 Tax=Aedes albopictus TaxID=7160 RepID=A0ABM1YMQ4_AEDAL